MNCWHCFTVSSNGLFVRHKKGDGERRTWETKLFFVVNSAVRRTHIYQKRFRLMPAFNDAESFIYEKLSRLHSFAVSLSLPLACASTTSDNGNDKRLEQIENEKQTKSFVPCH